MRPFPRYDKFFNWYYINLVSPQSGISVEGGTTVNNALGGTRDNDRLGYVNHSKASALFTEVQQNLGVTIHWRQVILNINGYYNSGGAFSCFAFPNWGDIACHEAGHSFHQFADEYGGSGTDTREYTEINSTADPKAPKWSHWIGYKDIDSKLDTMGVYQGSRYVSAGQYRPSKNSKMNMTSQSSPTSFNAICREKIIHDIYNLVKPIDTMLANTGTVNDPDSVWVRVIDPAVLKVDWYVNGTLKKANGGTALRKNEITSAPGTFTVKAHVYDECIRHANSNNLAPDTLDLVRKDTTKMFQDVQWTVQVVNAPISWNFVDKPALSLAVRDNSLVFNLARPQVVRFCVMSVDGRLVRQTTLRGGAGKNTARIFDHSAMPGAGMYVLTIAADGKSQMVPLIIR
jgi:hypothetical protein